MKTLRLGSSQAELARAGRLLRAGELVIFPTETVYGLGALADEASAVARVYKAKRRPADNPLIVHVRNLQMAEIYARELREVERCLLEAFAPGPFTLVLERRPGRAAAAAAGQTTIALRIPALPLAQGLIEAAGSGIAAPSANRSGRPSPTDFNMAWHEMAGRVAAVIEGGPCAEGLESTIVRCSGDRVRVLRPGSVSKHAIRRALRGGGFPERVEDSPGSEPSVTPGTQYQHYAPRSPLRLYETAEDLRSAMVQGRAIWVILPGEKLYLGQSLSELRRAASGARTLEVKTVEDYAHRLYRLFHHIDQEENAQILAYLPPEGPTSEALRDRLQRAAGLK